MLGDTPSPIMDGYVAANIENDSDGTNSRVVPDDSMTANTSSYVTNTLVSSVSPSPSPPPSPVPPPVITTSSSTTTQLTLPV